jgi:CheY-like chemotaxis protein
MQLPIGLNILIVDDAALNGKMMKQRLEKLKCNSLEVDDGDVAVDMVQASLRGTVCSSTSSPWTM